MEKLPKKTKQLKGTYRPDKEFKGIEAGERLETAPTPPDFLSVGARQEWEGLADILTEMGVQSRADLRDLALCCEALATATELENVIRAEGYTLPAVGGSRKGHPALKALETTRNQAHRMLADFGLNPKARKFVEKAPEKPGRSGFLPLSGPRPLRGNPLNGGFRPTRNIPDDDDFEEM